MPNRRTTRWLLWGLAVLVLCVMVSEGNAQNAPPPAPAAGVAPAAAEGGEADEVKPKKEADTLWKLLLKGREVMIPIGLCSVIALAVSVERFLSLRRKKVVRTDFLEGLKKVLEADPKTPDAGVRYCEEHPCPLSNIFRAGLRRLKHGDDAVEKAIEDAGSREVHRMKRSLRWLSVIATVAPLLGLLGTVYGMIGAFQAASAQGVGKSETLARGIYEALVTTAAGLTLAIPVLIVYYILIGRVDVLVDAMDDHAVEFIEYSMNRS